MSWKHYLITILVAFVSGYVGHLLASERERASKRRDVRIEYLIDAYQRLADASQREPVENSPHFRNMESAIADIQLFGSPSQIAKVHIFLDEFAQKGEGTLDPLLNDLRDALRNELGLSDIEENVHWFRPEGAPQKVDLNASQGCQ